MIAFLINELDIRGGTHKQLLKLLEYTATQTDDFFIVTNRLDLDKTYPGFREFENKIKLLNPIIPGKSLIGKLRAFFKNRKMLRDIIQDADIINIHDQGFEWHLSVFKGKRVIWQVNDLPSIFQVGVSKHSKLKWKSKFAKKMTILNSRVIDRFTVNVSKNRERIRRCFNRDAEVLYCGIEPIGISHDIQESVDRFKYKKINLLSSGVFFPYRNYETQIEVVALLKEAGWNVHLNIIGSTERDKVYSEKIGRLIEQHHLSDEITICGQVGEVIFRNLHKNADIFLFINVDQSWGLAVFEAMSCGVPVIVSESVGATEILINEENALFVNPTNAAEIATKIIRLAQNPEEYSALCQAGLCFPEKYSWDKAYSKPMFNILSQS